MKYHNAFVDDAGQGWEFSYEEHSTYERSEDEQFVCTGTVVLDFRYRKEGETEWLSLPPWADVAEEWKITLCLFDEDEETEELTFWKLEEREQQADFTIGLPGGEG